MLKQALSDGSVWLAIGMACFALFFALEHWAGTNATVEFIRGFLIGLAIVAFGAAIVMLAAQHSPSRQKPAGRSTPTKKGRR
jgi:hypothetical protein